MRIHIIILLFLMVIVGCSNSNQSLTLEQIVGAFQNEGLQLTEADENRENIFQQGINEVIPKFYRLSDGIIYFYIFKTEKEREKGREDFYHRPIEFVKHKAFEINNMLIFYVYGKNQSDEIDGEIEDVIGKLGNHSDGRK
ncbi:hypothetical protein A8709_27365 [Paenibacillus pectinilyticus]|uniref:Uncharacterized protein n=1 Tax=Paenibacillus pectinilyticus TaxID=512399 RepID=A0A1C1A9H3_9BACL|nr:hypothetical protein [Paenibacillus pectinilyticus]OCT17254.1 hypothetical protein A8709_27365 [Paenibacillus pectinilyticus]